MSAPPIDVSGDDFITESLSKHFAQLSVPAPTPATVSAWFDRVSVGVTDVFGLLGLQFTVNTVTHYTLLPILQGDAISSIGNSGLSFVGDHTITELTGQLISWAIIGYAGPGGATVYSVTFNAPGVGAAPPTPIATVGLNSPPTIWVGAAGTCAFFATPPQRT